MILTMKTPVELVWDLYDETNPRTFQQDLLCHFLNGYVFSTPEEFIMGRSVNSNAPEETIRDPEAIFPQDECDCWLIYAYATRKQDPKKIAGLVEKVLRWMPYELPLVAWDRKHRGKMLFFPIEKFKLWTNNSHSAQ